VFIILVTVIHSAPFTYIIDKNSGVLKQLCHIMTGKVVTHMCIC